MLSTFIMDTSDAIRLFKGFKSTDDCQCPPSHYSLTDFSVTEIIHGKCSNVNRINIENRIIFGFGTLTPLGLNTKFDAFSLT